MLQAMFLISTMPVVRRDTFFKRTVVVSMLYLRAFGQRRLPVVWMRLHCRFKAGTISSQAGLHSGKLGINQESYFNARQNAITRTDIK